jgi:hypothetical protein
MAYTPIQTLRKARATNKGLNRKLAKTMRDTAALLERKGPDEFTQTEVRALKLTARTLLRRLRVNELTKALQLKTDTVIKFGAALKRRKLR